MLQRARIPLMRMVAPTKWGVAPAALVGLVHGALYLDESVDLATAVGICDFLSLSVGPWLAVLLYRLLIRGYAVWMTAIVDRLDIIEPPNSSGVETQARKPNDSKGVGVGARAVGHSFYLTIFCCGAMITGLVLATLTAQVEGYDYRAYLVGAAGFFVVFACTLVLQCSYFALMQRRAASIEAKLRSLGASPDGSFLVSMQTAALSASIARTERLGCRFLGMRSITAD
jgi:hypothetical protein